MATNEKNIVITTEVKQGEIINNFAAIKDQVEKKIAPYMGLVFGDDDIKDAKTTLADLRKMRTTIEDKRKSIKKQWNEPYVAFENQVKEITEIIDRPIAQIDEQVKDYEARRKEKKRNEVDGMIDKIISEIEDDGDREFVLACGITGDERWLNATTALSQVEKDVTAQIERILNDSATITEVCEGDDMLTDLLVDYQNSKDLSAVLRRRKELLDRRESARKMKEAQEARRAMEEASRKAQKEAEEAETTVAPPAEPEAPQVPEEAPAANTRKQPDIRTAFVLQGSLEDLQKALGALREMENITITRLFEHSDNERPSYWTTNKEN